MADPLEVKRQRAERANQLIQAIAVRGRKFFAHNGRVASFSVDEKGRVWFTDDYTQRRLYCHHPGALTKGFTGGGTLRSLVLHLKNFIMCGRPLPLGFLGPWPAWVCDGDLWGYGEAMAEVRKAALALGVAGPAAPAGGEEASREGGQA